MSKTGSEARAADTRPTGYEPPRVERVLATEELEREVLYAGVLASGRN
jgi:hypothetical protein